MCKSERCFYDDNGCKWVYIKGRLVPKKQLDDVHNELLKIVRETEKQYENNKLNMGKKHEEF